MSFLRIPSDTFLSRNLPVVLYDEILFGTDSDLEVQSCSNVRHIKLIDHGSFEHHFQ